MIKEALKIAYAYIISETNVKKINDIQNILLEITKIDFDFSLSLNIENCTYDFVQEKLSKLNERESIRKAKGVYYTPADVVDFIVKNSVTLTHGNKPFSQSEDIDYKIFCKQKSVFDPTCGAGEFLLATLEKKFDLWDSSAKRTIKTDVEKMVSTIYGNDINGDSVAITKIRLFICAVKRYGVEKCVGLAEILNGNFTSTDYVIKPPNTEKGYDLIIGNPPYVEDSKSGLDLTNRYGNIYANVLVNAAERLSLNGVFGFIIPLSYVATPRMQRLREDLYRIVPEQYILNYSDRPDCLFTSVHQKLCILLCKRSDEKRIIYTGNYQYWYKEERSQLFERTSVVENNYITDTYIPKLGNDFDISIFSKISCKKDRMSIKDMAIRDGQGIYLNMRAAFWIKAFMNYHTGSEYKILKFENNEIASYMMCIFNSSLFWWYWICISDCWHITQKELTNFMVPQISDYTEVCRLAEQIERRLEETKVYVGTVQTEYEYKHKFCVPEIHEIDDYINNIFGLTYEESEYIKNFAHLYRISGGVVNEGN